MNNATKWVSCLLLALPLLAAAAPAVAPAPAPAAAVTPPPKPVDTTPQVAAYAELVTGSVTVGTGAATKSLSSGDAILERQTVVVGPNSYANLRFQDGGHVLLRPNSEFAIESFRYTAPPVAATPVTATPAPGAAPVAPAPVGSSAFFRLVKGGFRAISGLIGKTDHEAYRVSTPAATIGIRGTDYEVAICTDDCPAQATASAGGVVAATHEGSITLRTSRGEYTVDAGHVLLALLDGQTFVLPVIPDTMIHNPAPSPERCK